jgi:hypothetical protein
MDRIKTELPKIAQEVIAIQKEIDNTKKLLKSIKGKIARLMRDGVYERAIEICKIALEYNLHDGTKGGV